MSSTPADPELLPWALSVLGASSAQAFAPIAGDASARRYFRLTLAEHSFIAVEAPPQSEKNAEFLAVRALLDAAGIRVPAMVAADLARGFLLLGDLGDRLLLAELTPASVDRSYRAAFDVLQKMGATAVPDPNWPHYDDELLSEELSRFPHWFVVELLAAEPPPNTLWETFSSRLTASALEQPRVLVHRDFHSRNLMPQADGALAVIDFQDAVVGPVSYDLVSLLRDCYIRWEPEQVSAWALAYLARLQQAGALVGVSEAVFLRWFDLMGLQRHLKVLGTFARLYLRDGKSAYLADLPLVMRYIREVLHQRRGECADIAAFADWFETAVVPVFSAQPWGPAP